MNPNVWGKYQWTSIHFCALGYPKNPSNKIKQNFKIYFNDILPEILPCESCRTHLRKTLQSEHPITDNDLKNKDTLFKWTVDLHNIVNQRLHKPIISLETALSIYMYQDKLHNALCNNIIPLPITTLDTDSNNNIKYILLILFLIFILTFNIYYFKIFRRINFMKKRLDS